MLSVRTVPIYEKAIEVCIELYNNNKELKYIDEAYKYLQKSKSLSLIEKMKDNDAKDTSEIPHEVIKQEVSLNNKISELEKSLYEENKKRNKSQLKLDELRNKLFVLKQKLEAFIKKLEKDYPDYKILKENFKTAGSDEIVKQIPEDTIVIEYFLGDENIFAFVFSGSGFYVNQIRKKMNFDKNILDYRKSITQINISSDESSVIKFKKLSYFLYKTLLKNILAPHIDLINKNKKKGIPVKNILIIPDNELNFISFDSLITSDHNSSTNFKELPYLIKYFNIIFSYSIILYLKNSGEVKRKINQNIIAFAPVFKTREKVKSGSNCEIFRNSLSPLKFNQNEVRGISKYFSGEYYYNKNAMKEKFIKNKKHFSILHFATHSVLDDENPMYSKIVFSKSDKEGDDGFLHTYEIYSLNSIYDLVVLSACNTGSGKMIRGEGVMSIARAFASSGSRNIVMSLWQVNDKSTSEIMNFFYRNIAKGEKVGEALRIAKLKYLEKSDGIKSMPFYWSPFISFGANNSLN